MRAAYPEGSLPELRVTISIDGPYPTALGLAAFLEREGCLERMVTAMPRFRIPWAEISDGRLVRLWPLAYLAYAGRSAPILKSWQARTWYICEMFDRLASERLGACTVFNGWSTVALHSLRRAKAHGARTVLQTGSTHLEAWQQLVEAECIKFGVRPRLNDPRLVEKAKQEYAEADVLLVPSEFVMRTFAAKGVDPSRIRIAPPEPMQRGLLTSPRAGAKRDFPAHPREDDVFRVIFVGRVELRKGVQYLLEAFKQLNLHGAELLLVGGIQDDMQGITAKYAGSYQNTRFLAGDDLSRAYSQSSVCVVPSVEDGWGLVTAEAMSCGLPVIVSTNTGSADLVEDGVTGFLVPAGDAEALADRMMWVHDHPSEAQAMGERGREQVKGQTAEEYGSKMLALFNSLVPSTHGQL